MKLSELVTFRNQLRELDIHQARDHTRLDLGQFKHIVDSHQIKIGQYQHSIDTQYNEILNQINKI